jgi:muconolactone delta-isomerase
MEYLVTMTTHVPDGTPEETVDDVRAREAAHTRELAAQGHVLRLWRPPLAPGEWRTLGLFAAADTGELEQVLASMPLWVWRKDHVMELTAHPNDPDPATASGRPPASEETSTEFLVCFTPAVRSGAPAAERACELVRPGHLVRLWMLPVRHGASSALGLWRAGGWAAYAAFVEDQLRHRRTRNLLAWLVTAMKILATHAP